MDKKSLNEAEIRTRYITPAILASGWNVESVREEYFYFTNGRIIVRGKKSFRKAPKKVDYLLYGSDANIPLAVVEAKDNNHNEGDGMQQAVEYAEHLDVPFVFTSNGDSFVIHDRTGLTQPTERTIPLDEFPSPYGLEQLYKQWRGVGEDEQLLNTPYYSDSGNKKPRYYQRIAINRAIEAIAKGQKRILLVMATGTGKTYTAAQIIWKYWKTPSADGKQKRILFLADRNILVDQTKNNDFKHFGTAMTKITDRTIDKSYEIYLSLYQAVTGKDEASNVYKEFDRDFFDLIVVDECHRGSSKEDSSWRQILEYFDSAVQIGMTATPIETKVASSSYYFGEPVYTYSLKTGIDDGFLAPYKVIRVATDVDTFGYRPEADELDDEGNEIPDKEYTSKDFDRKLILPERDKKIASYITKFLQKTDPYAKTIVFCRTVNHAARIRQALINENPDYVRKNSKYIMRITGDDEIGKAQLDSFIDPESTYPVIATTSKLMTTGIDAQTCKVIVLDSNIESMTEFKQIIGRGTRVNEDFGKTYFTILDFRNVTKLFSDPDFDGDPVRIYEPANEDEFIDVINDIEDENPPQYEPTENGDSAVSDPGAETEIYIPAPKGGGTTPIVYTVSGKRVEIIGERVQILDADGKIITESLTDFTKKGILDEYATLNDFLQAWDSAKRKFYILDELEQKGVPIHELSEQYGDDIDIFDLVLHIAYDKKPVKRHDRASAARQGKFMQQYQGKAREVLEALLDKYADSPVQSLDDLELLRIHPIDLFGTPIEIASYFGGRDQYLSAVSGLERELYETTNSN